MLNYQRISRSYVIPMFRLCRSRRGKILQPHATAIHWGSNLLHRPGVAGVARYRELVENPAVVTLKPWENHGKTWESDGIP